MVQDNRDRLGAASKLGGVSEGDASNFSRFTCALGLQIIADWMSHSWAFSVATDVSTDGFRSSHLDVHIRMPGRDVAKNLLSFHLLAVPIFEAAHSSASLFISFLKVFDALYLEWKDNIIVLYTGGMQNVMGYNIGFTTQLINVAVGGKFDQVQGMAHQLNLIIKAGLQEIAKSGYLTLFEVAMTIIR